jgi:hypothetical protein
MATSSDFGSHLARGFRPAGFSAILLALLAAFALPIGALADDSIHAGPLLDQFELTLKPGHRTEAVGPLFYSEESGTASTWAFPPLLSRHRDLDTDLTEFDLLYPIFSYDRYGTQHRWHFFEVLSFAGGPSQTETNRNRFTLFPLYFQQRSSDPAEDYTAFFPLYGTLKHRLFRDEIYFVLFPLYSETRKKDVVTDNYLNPLFAFTSGIGLSGWQFWPLAGHENKDVTFRTNIWNETETVAGHENLFILWPLFFNERTGLGTENPAWQQTSIPLYSVLRSPQRDSTTILWPFFNYIDDREKKYREWDGPWPFVEFARGEGKNTSRVFPFYSHAQSATLESDFVLWPLYKHDHTRAETLDRDRTRILFYVYSDATDKNTDTGESRRFVDMWPLFTYHRGFDGNSRFQVLAPLEPFVPGSHKIERDYSPVWSIWRSENNLKTGASSQSLLWNLYRREVTPERRRVSVFFGLFQHESSAEGKRTRLFFIPL